MSRRNARGFTLIETLVAVVLVAIGLVAVFGGIAALNRAEVKARSAELLQSLAMQKISEYGAVTDPRSAETSGDFSDQGYSDITWRFVDEPSGITDVDKLTVTVAQGSEEQTLTTLIYIRPTTSTTGTTP